MDYSNENRGTFQYDRRARQLIRFEGLRYGNITPTDIDVFAEYHDRAFIFAEIKHRDAQMPRGQGLALTRLVDRLRRGGTEAVLLLCEHDVDDTGDDVYAADVTVNAVYYRGRWSKTRKKLKEVAESFIDYAKKKEDKDG